MEYPHYPDGVAAAAVKSVGHYFPRRSRSRVQPCSLQDSLRQYMSWLTPIPEQHAALWAK